MAPAKGSHQFCNPGEEMFLIETRQQDDADTGDAALPPPPKAAQVVGAVTYKACPEYTDKAEFRAEQQRHRILPGSSKDWDDDLKRFAWEVESVRRFLNPVPSEGHNMYGYQKAKTLEVEVAAPASAVSS